jgi:hypothetical protein
MLLLGLPCLPGSGRAGPSHQSRDREAPLRSSFRIDPTSLRDIDVPPRPIRLHLAHRVVSVMARCWTVHTREMARVSPRPGHGDQCCARTISMQNFHIKLCGFCVDFALSTHSSRQVGSGTSIFAPTVATQRVVALHLLADCCKPSPREACGSTGTQLGIHPSSACSRSQIHCPSPHPFSRTGLIWGDAYSASGGGLSRNP